MGKKAESVREGVGAGAESGDSETAGGVVQGSGQGGGGGGGLGKERAELGEKERAGDVAGGKRKTRSKGVQGDASMETNSNESDVSIRATSRRRTAASGDW